MTITATGETEFLPPRVVIEVATPVGSVMTEVTVWRNGPTGRVLTRTQPVAGFDQRTIYDYEPPYGVPITYSWEAKYLVEPTELWAEEWADLGDWTQTGTGWAVDVGELVWDEGDNTAAKLTRAITPGRYRVTFETAPTGFQTVEFGGFYIDIPRSRIYIGAASTVFTPGTGSWVIDVTETGVTLTTSAGTYSVTGSAEISKIEFSGILSIPTFSRKIVGIESPSGVATDSAGNLYVADATDNNIRKYDPSGNLLLTWGSTGTGDGQFTAAYGITIDASDGIFVVDLSANRIQKFTTTGTFVSKFGSTGSGNGQFDVPLDAACDAAGNIYVADMGNNRIQKFNSSGVYVTQWNDGGTFVHPSGIEVDAAGNVWACNDDVSGMNYTVRKFSNTGTKLLQFGSYGTGDGQFIRPSGIAIDDVGDVYVVELNHRVQKFTAGGTFLGKFGSYGTGDGQLAAPRCITIRGETVYVGDGGLSNDRVSIFTTSVVAAGPISLSDYGSIAEHPYETSEAVTVTPVDGWFVHPANPGLSVPISFDDLDKTTIRTIDEIVQDSTSTTHQILGQSKPIPVSSGPRASDQSGISLAIEDKVSEAALIGLFADQTPILIQFPPAWEVDFPAGFYDIGRVTITRNLQMYGQPSRVMSFPIESVEAPIASVENVGWSWAALADEFPTWESVLAAFESWADVLVNQRRPGF